MIFLNIIVLVLEILYYSIFMYYAKGEGKFWRYLLLFSSITFIGCIIGTNYLFSYLILVLMMLYGIKYIVKAKTSLYELAFGKTVNEEMTEEWVKGMKPIGKHWTKEQTTEAMNSIGYSLDPVQFYIVANMMYNDHYDNVKENEELSLKLAKDWLADEDAKQDKLYCYWKHIIKRD